MCVFEFFFFSSRRRHTRLQGDWSSDVCSSDLVQELRESQKIVKQALEGIPEGAVKADAPHVVLPDREKMKTQMEALIYHFKIVTEGFTVPEGEVYMPIESPRGEMGYY